jgi:hypothetical protein
VHSSLLAFWCVEEDGSAIIPCRAITVQLSPTCTHLHHLFLRSSCHSLHGGSSPMMISSLHAVAPSRSHFQNRINDS